MKMFIKNIGRFFVELSRQEEDNFKESVLLVDGSFILPNNFALIIRDVRNKLRNAELTVLVFEDKKDFIRDIFPDIEIIVPPAKFKNKRHRLAIQLLFLLRRRFKFVILSSLDISLLAVSMAFTRRPVFLLNRWMEWYRIRQRMLTDLIARRKSADSAKRKTYRGIKEIVRLAGRFFIILTEVKEDDIATNILIEDNGYTETGYIISAVRNSGKIFINPHITMLTFDSRKEDFINNFSHLDLVAIDPGRNRYKMAMEMYRLRHREFDFVILTSLDVSPVLASFLFLRAKILLYNRWHQWWVLRFRNLLGYLKAGALFLATIPITIYLLVVSGFVLVRTFVRSQLARVIKDYQ